MVNTEPTPVRKRSPLAARPTLGRSLAIVLVMLLVSEMGARAIEDRLPESKAGDQVEVELKWDQILALEDGGQPTDIVFFGNSAMDAAVDPAVWAESSSRYPAAYNASLLGQPFDSMERWADDFVLEEMDPDVIVVGVTPYDVPVIEIQGSSRQIIEAAFSSTFDRLRSSPLNRLDRKLSSWSALVRNRASVRSPGAIWRAARDAVLRRAVPPRQPFQPVTLPGNVIAARTPEVWSSQLMKPRGGNANYHGVTSAPPAIDFNFSAGQQEAFRSSVTTRAQLAALVAAARRHGIEQVVFVIPPSLPDAYLPLTGDGTHVFDAIARIGDDARDLGVAVFDFSRVDWPDTEFADSVHLNQKGSVRFSRLLAQYVDQL